MPWSESRAADRDSESRSDTVAGRVTYGTPWTRSSPRNRHNFALLWHAGHGSVTVPWHDTLEMGTALVKLSNSKCPIVTKVIKAERILDVYHCTARIGLQFCKEKES